MKKPLDKNPTIGRGRVRADEILTLRQFGRELGLATRALCDCQRQGLRTILCGRVKMVLGSDALDFFRRLKELMDTSADAMLDIVIDRNDCHPRLVDELLANGRKVAECFRRDADALA